jgi:hypothetical protein
VAKSAFGLRSPSKVFKDIGRKTVQGLILGLRAETPALVRQAARTADILTSGVSPTISPAALAGARSAGAAPIVVHLAVPPVADPAEVGRQVVKALKAFAGSTGRSIVVNA